MVTLPAAGTGTVFCARETHASAVNRNRNFVIGYLHPSPFDSSTRSPPSGPRRSAQRPGTSRDRPMETTLPPVEYPPAAPDPIGRGNDPPVPAPRFATAIPACRGVLESPWRLARSAPPRSAVHTGAAGRPQVRDSLGTKADNTA